MNWIYAMVRFICQLHGLEVCRLLMAVQTWDFSSPPLSCSALALCHAWECQSTVVTSFSPSCSAATA